MESKQNTRPARKKAAVTDHEHPIDPRPELRLPAEVMVLGQRFVISVHEHPSSALDADMPKSHGSLGLCDRQLNTITIRGGAAMSEDKAREVLLHEVLHAIIGTARISDQFDDDGEEMVVSQLAPMLLHTLRDNPTLVAALISK